MELYAVNSRETPLSLNSEINSPVKTLLPSYLNVSNGLGIILLAPAIMDSFSLFEVPQSYMHSDKFSYRRPQILPDKDIQLYNPYKLLWKTTVQSEE